VRKRRAGSPDGDGHVDLVEWLEADGQELVARYDRLYVPRNDPRWLRRNAAVALGNVGGEEHVAPLERAASGDDELVAEHARWALARIAART
jgi:epoxyqueuosine reductase